MHHRIDLDNVIKVADFGLSEDVYAKNYYRQTEMEECKVKLPIRWMALESLHDGIFSEKSDVVRRQRGSTQDTLCLKGHPVSHY